MEMPIHRKYCLTDSSGEDIYLFTLSNTKGTRVMVTNYGAIINSFLVKNHDGTYNDIVLGFENIEDYWSNEYLKQYPWFGCAVGRYANRIENATFSIDGKKYLLTKNRGDHQLHGGPQGFDKKTWQYVLSGESPHPFLVLKYLSIDGEEGFPGAMQVEIRFELSEENELSYQYKATCNQPTAVNLTHHSYFNLNNGTGNIHDHEIKIFSSAILEVDNELIPTGKIIRIKDSVYDFNEFQSIGDRLAVLPEFDNSFIVDKEENPGILSLMAEARSVKSNTMLQVYSTEPTVHFYTGKWTPAVKGKNGTMYGPFSGFCLETQKHINAINIPHFPNTILRQGETYYQKTIYKILQT